MTLGLPVYVSAISPVSDMKYTTAPSACEGQKKKYANRDYYLQKSWISPLGVVELSVDDGVLSTAGRYMFNFTDICTLNIVVQS